MLIIPAPLSVRLPIFIHSYFFIGQILIVFLIIAVLYRFICLLISVYFVLYKQISRSGVDFFD